MCECRASGLGIGCFRIHANRRRVCGGRAFQTSSNVYAYRADGENGVKRLLLLMAYLAVVVTCRYRFCERVASFLLLLSGRWGPLLGPMLRCTTIFIGGNEWPVILACSTCFLLCACERPLAFQELSFDYQWEAHELREATKCLCGTPSCR